MYSCYSVCHDKLLSECRVIVLFFFFVAIISLFSVESFRQGSSHNSGQQSQTKLGNALHQHKVDLPASYGRRLISEEEMDIINVRISIMVQLSYFDICQ